MTATEVEATTEPELNDEQLEALLHELEKQYPVPTWDDVKPEWKWIYETRARNTVDPFYKCAGLNVAIFNQSIVGMDAHWMKLRIRLSRELGVHPERIVVLSYPDFWTE